MAYNTSKGPRDLGDLKNEADTDTQIDWEDDYIGLKTGGTTRLAVSGTAGNVGIGTVSPSHTLQIDSNSGVEGLQVNGDANQYVASFRASTTTGQSYGPYMRGGTNSSDAALTVDNAAGTTSLLKLTGEGKLGIGIASPTHKLTVAGTISGSSILEVVGNTFIGGALNVSGAVTATGIASGSTAGPGSFLAVTTAGLLVLDEPAGGGGISWDGSTANGIATFKDSDEATVESNLTFDGTTLAADGAISGSGTVQTGGGLITRGMLQVSGAGVISGSFRAKQLHITRHAYNVGGAGERFIPFYTLTDAAAPGSADENTQMVAPFDGILKRVIFRPTSAQGGGTSRVALYKQTNGTALIGSGDIIEHLDVTCSGVAATSNVFNFSGSSHFSAGDVVGVSIDPHLGPNDTFVTCIWELEMLGI
tara:strand:+ start:229 stop:1488 length:1260 start_codon:yes stop_codon:yes gene_type:complete